jgi:hypothetical protein
MVSCGLTYMVSCGHTYTWRSVDTYMVSCGHTYTWWAVDTLIRGELWTHSLLLELNLIIIQNKVYALFLALAMIRLVLLILCQNDIQEEFQKFVNFDVWDLTFCDFPNKLGWVCGWWVDCHCCHGFAQNTFSAVKLCCSLSDVLCS